MVPPTHQSVRLLALSGLAVIGVLCASTAATVYAVAVPRRAAAGGAANAAVGAHDWRTAAAPNDRTLVQVAADPRHDSGARLAAVRDIAYGACLSPGEMLLGARATRHVALRDAIMGTRDVPGASVIASSARRALVAFDRGDARSVSAIATNHGRDDNGELARPLSLVLPAVIEHRLALCEAIRPR